MLESAEGMQYILLYDPNIDIEKEEKLRKEIEEADSFTEKAKIIIKAIGHIWAKKYKTARANYQQSMYYSTDISPETSGTAFDMSAGYLASSVIIGEIGAAKELMSAGKVDILSGKTLTNQTGKLNNYVSGTKGNAAAQADFNAMKPTNVRTYPNGTTVGNLPDGTMINLHPSTSLGGTPTVEIYNPSTGISTKIRY